MDGHTDRWVDKEIDKLIERQTYGQTDKLIDRQTDG
jgi:hypothetical protein